MSLNLRKLNFAHLEYSKCQIIKLFGSLFPWSRRSQNELDVKVIPSLTKKYNNFPLYNSLPANLQSGSGSFAELLREFCGTLFTSDFGGGTFAGVLRDF